MTAGTLENEIMNAVWTIEEQCCNNKLITNISVSEVLHFINSCSSAKAYTTVKTVMDRLVKKQYLKRFKDGKKFFYNSTSSRAERAEKAINHLASQYFNNDIQSLLRALEKECLKKS